MALIIRQEEHRDHEAVRVVISAAFSQEEMSDNTEQYLVERLRQSSDFIPELSLVAELDGVVVGHILLSKIVVRSEAGDHPSLALAPVSVSPKEQGNGVGSQLIRVAHAKATELGHGAIILLGHADYYPRFGYQQLDGFGIELPFDVPKENCFALELKEGTLTGVSGVVVYPPEFGAEA